MIRVNYSLESLGEPLQTSSPVDCMEQEAGA
jgi:hypothetical protein